MDGYRGLFDDRGVTLHIKVIALYAILATANLLAWAWAFAAFHGNTLLLGTALLAYGFGLRHAVDADHIAAIDNVTRKLMQEGKRPIGVGFFFALGHSTVVIIAVAVIAVTASTLQDRFPGLLAVGGVIGTNGLGRVPVHHRDDKLDGARRGLPAVSAGQTRRHLC